MESTGGYHPFPATHWSLVRRAGEEAGAGGADGEARRAALEVLLSRYAPALRSYLRVVRGVDADAAAELVQAFIAESVLGQELLRRADAQRGRFRTLLLTCLNHFATSKYRAQQRRATEPLDAELVDGRVSPAAAVESAWARALIQSVLAEMRRECETNGRMDVWAIFEGRVLAAAFESQKPLSYKELAVQFGLQSPSQAANLLVTAKRTYARLLRAAVAEYERDGEDIDAEIMDLRRILAESRGRTCGEARR